MCQPNPSGIRYFKPILSSFKNCDFLSSPYRGVGGYRTVVVEI